MNILSVDTTTPWGSVALLRDGDVKGEVRLHEETGHSRALFFSIEHLTRSLGLAPTDIEAFVAAVGPGSFTGVRVGVSAVQGLALASSRPCLGLSTLVGLAAKMQGLAPRLVPLIEGYRDQVYGAVYDPDLQTIVEPVAIPLDDLLARLDGPAAFLGSGVRRHRDHIAAAYPEALFPDRSLYVAAALGRLGGQRLAAGGGGSAAELRPLYLRPPDIKAPAAAKV